jgi:hypothetical protein
MGNYRAADRLKSCGSKTLRGGLTPAPASFHPCADNRIEATSNNFDFCCERLLRRLASFHKLAVFRSILLACEALSSIRKSSFSRRNQWLEVPLGYSGVLI